MNKEGSWLVLQNQNKTSFGGGIQLNPIKPHTSQQRSSIESADNSFSKKNEHVKCFKIEWHNYYFVAWTLRFKSNRVNFRGKIIYMIHKNP